jgi:phosphohistidine phosphatase
VDLYVIRHAEAVPLGENNIKQDEDRPLTDKGRQQCQLVAAGLQQRGVRLDVLVTSPLVRARQTAEGILGSWVGAAPRIQECDHQAPAGKRRKLAQFLEELNVDAVGVVGHQPDLGELIGWLIGSRRAGVEMAKAGVAYLVSASEIGKGSATLEWLVTPEWFETPAG